MNKNLSWDEDVKERYPEPESPSEKDDGSFRDYSEETRAGVREFYRQNHQLQTVAFNKSVRNKYLPLRQMTMGIFTALQRLDEIVDDSDPDTEFAQIDHAMQTAEAIRADGHPEWFIVTGLIHDLGKVLCLFGEPQWAVVGDTFPVGCAWSSKIVLSEYFSENPDQKISEYQSKAGIYEEGCGLDKLMISWGHDEYLYHVVRNYLPEEGLAMIRYHSFYPCHRENEYGHFLTQKDQELLKWVRLFNRYDLYTKHDVKPDTKKLLPYYEKLVQKFFPAELQW